MGNIAQYQATTSPNKAHNSDVYRTPGVYPLVDRGSMFYMNISGKLHENLCQVKLTQILHGIMHRLGYVLEHIPNANRCHQS